MKQRKFGQVNPLVGQNIILFDLLIIHLQYMLLSRASQLQGLNIMKAYIMRYI